jgi:hypothetical protein
MRRPHRYVEADLPKRVVYLRGATLGLDLQTRAIPSGLAAGRYRMGMLASLQTNARISQARVLG